MKAVVKEANASPVIRNPAQAGPERGAPPKEAVNVRPAGRKGAFILAAAVCGEFALVCFVDALSRYTLPAFPPCARGLIALMLQWSYLIIPLGGPGPVRDKLRRIGFGRERIGRQVWIGILTGLLLSAALTVAPILLGLKNWISSRIFTSPGEGVFFALFSILGTGLCEEIFFRGYVYTEICRIGSSRLWGLILSSALFGLFHALTGFPLQMLTTAVLGAVLCRMEQRMKDCTLLSLILAHGLYAALIPVWASVL